jgi:signal transduction histidine kinase/CheY-like chemotaxis protein
MTAASRSTPSPVVTAAHGATQATLEPSQSIPLMEQAISPAGRAQLLEITYSRIRLSITVLPVIALCLSWFYARSHSAVGMWLWCAFYVCFALGIRWHHRSYVRDQTALSDASLLAKWQPFIEKLAIVHGFALSAPAFITLGQAPFDFGILFLLTLAAITAGNATHQTPVLGIFWRFFIAGWNLTVVMVCWIFPQHWPYILPMTVMYSFLMYRHARMANQFFIKQIVLEERSIALAAQYKAAKDQAEEALSAKNQFLVTASHDLRQPVHSMGMLIEAIVQRNEQSSLVPLLGDLKSSVHSVNLMFNSLLDLSKIESGIVASNANPVQLAGLLRDVTALFREEAQRRGLQLRTRAPATHAVVLADVSLLRQALVNLVQNALRYTQTGGVLVAVRERRGAHGALAAGTAADLDVSTGTGAAAGVGVAAWKIEVWDTGVGVSQQEREQIYTPFYRNKNAWQIDSAGHGLGLAVVARCAKLMGASYGLSSQLGRGSRFWLTLPASTAASGLEPYHPTSPEAAAIHRLGPLHGNCLVVEDDPLVTAAWAALFQAWRVNARFVAHASEALAAIDAGFVPQAILCDQRLRSGESGFDILRALLERCPEASGAMVSGEYNAPELVQAESDGYLVLRKPLEVADLHEILARWFKAPA